MEVGSEEVLMQLVQLVVVVPEAWSNQREAAHSLRWTGVHVSNFPRPQNDCGSSRLQLEPDPAPDVTKMAWP